jgi:hypothetical protein
LLQEAAGEPLVPDRTKMLDVSVSGSPTHDYRGFQYEIQ